MKIDHADHLGHIDGRSEVKLFDNLPRTMRATAFAEATGLSLKTVYDWHHRGSDYGIPRELFFKIGRMLFVNTDVFLDWVAHQNVCRFLGSMKEE